MKIRTSIILLLALLLGALQVSAQKDGFVILGNVLLPDGYVAGVVCQTDTSLVQDMGSDTIRQGKFRLTGRLPHPQPATLMTNNLDLVQRNHWPEDSIRWTYTDIFLSNDTLRVSPDLHVEGSQVQGDFNAYQQTAKDSAAQWAFIDAHPHSVVSAWLANNILQRGYRLTDAQVEHLAATITAVPDDTIRMAELRRRIALARMTTIGRPLIDLELKDTKGQLTSLTNVLPKTRYVLVDFWASWCGICLYYMPAVKQLASDYQGTLSVVAVSIDTKEQAWKNSMAKHPEAWPQYITTAKGYSDFFHKYQVGNGVPYFLLIGPDRHVVASPDSPDQVRALLKAATEAEH